MSDEKQRDGNVRAEEGRSDLLQKDATPKHLLSRQDRRGGNYRRWRIGSIGIVCEQSYEDFDSSDKIASTDIQNGKTDC